MKPREGAGYGEVHLVRFSNQHEEARGVASICRYLIDEKRYDADDILILLRSDHLGRYSSVLETAISKRAMAVNVRAEKGDPLDEAPGRYLLSLMRLALNSQDDLAWRSLLQFSGRKTDWRYESDGDLQLHCPEWTSVSSGTRVYSGQPRNTALGRIGPAGGLCYPRTDCSIY
jgi:superfamily I DNA/RNA helicase